MMQSMGATATQDSMDAMAPMGKMAGAASSTSTSVTRTAPTKNGHNTPKGFGDCIFKGPLENLPIPKSVNIEAAIEQMYTDGYTIFPGVLNADEVKELRAKMDRSGGDDAQYHMKNWCYNKHVATDYFKDAHMLEYIDKPNLFEVVDAIHGGAQVNGGTTWVTGSGRQMGIHLDYLPVPMPEDVLKDPRVRIPIFSSTAHYYLNDLTVELGPTLLIPGSHRAGRPPENETSWNGVTPKAVMLKAGDVCLFRTEVWHGAWMNSCTTDRRYMLQVFYGNGSMGRHFPGMKYESLYDPAVLKAATPRQRKLLGG